MTLSRSLAYFMEEMCSYRREYLRKNFNLGSESRRIRSQELFNIFLELSEQDKRNYFFRVLNSTFKTTVEVFHSICLPFLGHMFKTDFQFVQEYYGHVKYERIHNKEIPSQVCEIILGFLPQDFHFDHKVFFSETIQTNANGEYFYSCEIRKYV